MNEFFGKYLCDFRGIFNFAVLLLLQNTMTIAIEKGVGMRKAQKKQAENFIQLLSQAHKEIKKSLETKKISEAMDLLAQCQEGVVELGNLIEQTEGENAKTIPVLESYCELAYRIYDQISRNELPSAEKVNKELHKAFIQIENSVKNDIKVRTEAVFLPYKASMWDSLESVWQAAEADPDCDAYVIPIPFYDKNPDGSFKAEHYEGDLFPDDVPITNFQTFDFGEHQPDMIFIHNPYDDLNRVTSVHPFFYSSNLKRFTETLVYIPYYSTAGGMSEGQISCPAYYNADYIVIQTEKYRRFFDGRIPEQKFLAFGSPKFDRIIRKCKNPPEPPVEWKEKMQGKKVYFYNTSLGGMLSNTVAFLNKMEYVFKCFENREDACLIWRPHPLMESTLDSMRAAFRPYYDSLKQYYMQKDFGIYDDTPDIANTIAMCDAYIGDMGTSVTSLFGIAGKPLFILDNNIHMEPGEDDWRGQIIRGFFPYNNDEWMVTQGNKLYRAENRDYHYRYFCDLSDYASGDYYSQVIRVEAKDYVCPANAQDILVIGENGIENKIELRQCMEQQGAFYGAVGWEHYLFLIPYNYPYIVRFDTRSGEVCYMNEHLDVFIGTVRGERRVGGYCIHNGYLFLASPIDNRVLAIHAATGKTQVMTTNSDNTCGCMTIASDGEELWLLPFTGITVTRWNPENGKMRKYSEFPDKIICKHPDFGYECVDRPFSFLAFAGDKAYLSPFWGDRYIEINKKTHEIREWNPPFKEPEAIKNEYFLTWNKANFVRPVDGSAEQEYLLFSAWDRKMYKVNPETGDCGEIEIVFDKDQVKKQEPGFKEDSQWFQYGCKENAWNSLKDFLDDTLTGTPFDKERQIQAYSEIAANCDGTSGENVYRFVSEKVRNC